MKLSVYKETENRTRLVLVVVLCPTVSTYMISVIDVVPFERTEDTPNKIITEIMGLILYECAATPTAAAGRQE